MMYSRHVHHQVQTRARPLLLLFAPALAAAGVCRARRGRPPHGPTQPPLLPHCLRVVVVARPLRPAEPHSVAAPHRSFRRGLLRLRLPIPVLPHAGRCRGQRGWLRGLHREFADVPLLPDQGAATGSGQHKQLRQGWLEQVRRELFCSPSLVTVCSGGGSAATTSRFWE